MRLNGMVTLASDDKIVGATCTVDGTPIIRFDVLSINVTWDQLRALHRECLKLEAQQLKAVA